MTYKKKLIEVALPLEAILEQIASAEKRSLSGQLAKIVDEWLTQYQSDQAKGKSHE